MKIHFKKIRSFFIPGFIGFVLFFPWRFQNGCTCITDQLLKWNAKPPQTQLSAEKQRNPYILPFGLFWWASAGLMTVALISENKPRRK